MIQQINKKRDFTVTQQWDYYTKDWPELRNEDYMKYCADHGVTSLQSYVYWASVEKKKGIYSFDFYDDIVSRMIKYGLKWVPFIIVGPDYATPDWFHDSPECVYAKCLEHEKESRIQSIWNPHIIKYIDALIKAIAGHFDHSVIESVLVGMSGNWGESIYPVGGGFNFNRRPFHTHLGWWCGDDYAVKDFKSAYDMDFPSRTELKIQRYVSRLLTLASVDYLDSVFLRYLTKRQRGEYLRRSNNFANWYISSMNNYVDKWLSVVRSNFPGSKIQVVTGGDGNPMIGVNFTEQTKIAKKYGAGIRITNQTDNPIENYVMCQWTATAAKQYGGYFTTEEALYNSYDGIKARLIDAVDSGASGVYFKTVLDCMYEDNCELKINGCGRGGSILRDNLRITENEVPIRNCALLLPTSTVRLIPFSINKIYEMAMKLKTRSDVDFICEDMINDGCLDEYDELLITSNAMVKSDIREIIVKWQNDGGKIVAKRGVRLYGI